MKANLENTPKAQAEFENWFNKTYFSEWKQGAFVKAIVHEHFYSKHFDFQQGPLLHYLRDNEQYLGIIYSPDPDADIIAAIEAGFAKREAELSQKS